LAEIDRLSDPLTRGDRVATGTSVRANLPWVIAVAAADIPPLQHRPTDTDAASHRPPYTAYTVADAPAYKAPYAATNMAPGTVADGARAGILGVPHYSTLHRRRLLPHPEIIRLSPKRHWLVRHYT